MTLRTGKTRRGRAAMTATNSTILRYSRASVLDPSISVVVTLPLRFHGFSHQCWMVMIAARLLKYLYSFMQVLAGEAALCTFLFSKHVTHTSESRSAAPNALHTPLCPIPCLNHTHTTPTPTYNWHHSAPIASNHRATPPYLFLEAPPAHPALHKHVHRRTQVSLVVSLQFSLDTGRHFATLVLLTILFFHGFTHCN